VVQTRPHREFRAQTQLAAQGFRSFLTSGGKIDEPPIGGVELARAPATIAALCVIIH
jgi:hypothetical protein